MAEVQVRVGADTIRVEDSSGDGRPLVLLHPGITDSRVWDPLLPLLGGHRVIRYFRRGFGRSAVATEEFRSLDDLVSVLDHLGLDRAHLVGNSMGGEASLGLAVTGPHRVFSMLSWRRRPAPTWPRKSSSRPTLSSGSCWTRCKCRRPSSPPSWTRPSRYRPASTWPTGSRERRWCASRPITCPQYNQPESVAAAVLDTLARVG